MSKKSIAFVAAALALALAGADLLAGPSAKAEPARKPLAFQQGRADVFVCPSPAPGATASAASSGKVKTVPGTTEFFSNVNCPGGAAFLFHGRPASKPSITRLRTVSGALLVRTFDVDQTGEIVGTMVFSGNRELPYRWSAAGVPERLATPNYGFATAIGKAGSPIAGEVVDSRNLFQAFRFAPTPAAFIGPLAYSIVNAVNGYSASVAYTPPVYVGELAGHAAAAVPPESFKALPIPYVSTALAIDDYDYIVGRYTLPKGTCGKGAPGGGFAIQYPDGKPTAVAPLRGDCTASAQSVNDAKAIVGFSSAGLATSQRAEGYDLPNFPAGSVDLNATKAYGSPPWARLGHRLIDATGIDDRGDITATDSAGLVWFLYF
jgi:hypothetical protein